MIVDEAIKHAEEVAEEKDKEAYMWEYDYDGNVPDTIAECKKCAEEHRQLAEWLKELKQLREQTRWIPVSERLPKVIIGEYDIQCSEDVLVYDGADLRVGYFVRNEKFDRGYWVVYGDDCFKPIAWMSLPKPYVPDTNVGDKAESEG